MRKIKDIYMYLSISINIKKRIYGKALVTNVSLMINCQCFCWKGKASRF